MEKTSTFFPGGEHQAARDELIAALIGLGRAASGHGAENVAESLPLVREALIATQDDAELSDAELRELACRVRAEKVRMTPMCAGCASPCGRTADFNLEDLLEDDERALMLRRKIVSIVQNQAAEGCADRALDALNTVGDAWGAEYLAGFAENLEK